MLIHRKIHFEISERKVLLRIFDIVSVFFALYIVGVVFDFDYFQIRKDNYYWLIVLGFYISLFGAVFEMYNLQVANKQYEVIRSILLTSSTTVLFYLLTPFYTPMLPNNRLQIIYFFLSILLALFLWRMIYLYFFGSLRFVKKVILVCDSNQAEELIIGLENADPHYKVLGYIDSDIENKIATKNNIHKINIEHLEKFVSKHSVSEIVIASQNTEGITISLYNKLLHLLENGFVIREYTKVYEHTAQRIPVQYVARDFYRYFPFSRSNQNTLYLLWIQIVEYTISFVGLLITGLLIPFILIGNFLGKSRGSLFYIQERVGKNGEIFKIHKFRTMIEKAESHGAVFAVQNDIRITPFGKFLRKTRIDELPQFINILKGEMGIIGPRPERPVFVKEISEIMPFYETRHIIKPGLTGWAQVNYGESIEDSLIKLQYDLYYIKHRSIFLDINIVIKTISTVLFYRGQ